MTRIDSATRKAQITEAAMEILSEGGCKDLVMVKIAKRIGITDAALYKHFKTKNDMLLFMLERIEETMVTRLIENTNKYSDSKEKLRSILSYQFNFIQKNKSIPRILFSEALQFKDDKLKNKINNILTSYKKYLIKILQTAQNNGNIRPDLNSEAVAIIFMGMIQSTVILWNLMNYSFSLKDREAVLWEEFSKIIE
ncbi:MAG TPA: TetR family transcriptional regulator [Ignavibacteria bacterium]|nr:TetR family transcriptional regulator [Ignavibacteria bacterium]